MFVLRVVTAAACVILIAAAAGLVVHLDGEHRLAVQAEVDEAGHPVPVGDVAPADPAGNGQAVCPPLSIAMAGALTGPDSEVAINIKNGVQLAIERHNTANAGCQVQIKEFDTRGDPRRVNDFAPQIVSDAYTVGLIGPTFSGVAQATGALFDANRLPAATASASRSALSEQGWTTFFRAVPSDQAQGRAVANYLANTLSYRRVCLMGDHSPYGDAVTAAAAAALGARVLPDCRRSFDQIKAASPDVVLHAGSQSGALLRHLRDAGVSAAFASAQSRKDPEFLSAAGRFTQNALMFCPCGPDPVWFGGAYHDEFGGAPGAYSVEGYDLATIMLNGIDAGMLVRRQMLDWMRHYNGQGVARRYQWTDTGELTDPTIWVYRVD